MVNGIVDFIENEIVRDNEPSNQFLVQFYPHHKNIIQLRSSYYLI